MVVLPLWAPIVIAAWTAALLDPVTGRITKLAKNHRSVGAAASVLLLLMLFVPVGFIAASLVKSALAFVTQVLSSPEAKHALELVVQNDEGDMNVQKMLEIAQAHGGTAWKLGQQLAGAGAWVLIAGMTFVVALFQFSVSGREMWAWVEEHAPVERAVAERLGKAFISTGRGIFIGAGLTALAQATVATVAFLVLGVPRAAVLGALTFVCAFVPAIGTAVIWGPVALGLALNGQTGKAIALVVVGIVGIGSIDNLLRPLLQKWGGNLDLPAWLLLVAAFGGLAAFGAAGLVLGPLTLRLAKEVVVIAKEKRASGSA